MDLYKDVNDLFSTLLGKKTHLDFVQEKRILIKYCPYLKLFILKRKFYFPFFFFYHVLEFNFIFLSFYLICSQHKDTC